MYSSDLGLVKLDNKVIILCLSSLPSPFPPTHTCICCHKINTLATASASSSADDNTGASKLCLYDIIRAQAGLT